MNKFHCLITSLLVFGCQQQEQISNTPMPVESCTVTAVSGGVNIICPNGSQSFVANGAAGAAGQTGATGATGATGPQGLPGTNITWVQFCTSCTATYPSDFPEGAFCINNNLYAVYSANDGFMSLLPPGEYSSDGINCSCTFTVAANCKIYE
jgi:hypothetical protein